MIMRSQIEEKRDKSIASTYEINVLTEDNVQLPVLISGSPIYAGAKLI